MRESTKGIPSFPYVLLSADLFFSFVWLGQKSLLKSDVTHDHDVIYGGVTFGYGSMNEKKKLCSR